MDITFTLQSTADGSLLTGQASNVTVYLSIDGAAFSVSTNAAQEIGRGAYKVTLTSAEAAFSTLLYAPVCSGAQSNILIKEADPVMPTVPTAAQNAAAVWGAQTKEITGTVTIDSTQASTLATASDLDTVAAKVELIKAKTDNLPTSPAATGDIPSVASIQSGLAKTSDLTGLSTFDPSNDTVTLNSTEDTTLTAIKTKVDTLQNTDLTGIATSTNVSNAQTAIIAAFPAVPTASEIWNNSTRTLTNSPNMQNELQTYGVAKTSDLPTDYAKPGDAMTLTNAYDAAKTASQLTTSDIPTPPTVAQIQEGLSTFNPLTDTVTINSTQAAGMATATGFATPSDIPSAENIWEYPTRTITDSPDIQAELTTYGAAKTSDIPTAQDIWEYPDRGLTTEIVVGISAQNIADITESVWNADDRTLTDMTPKPNQKNIVCTPSNVINSYGIPRLENWTNETAGTQAFDDKINTYITLAKEKMATDLNDQINAAIAYIGADNITELCAWLTGYNLYQDDESTDTDSLPETRYNQYLEQIHRIMENI